VDALCTSDTCGDVCLGDDIAHMLDDKDSLYPNDEEEDSLFEQSPLWFRLITGAAQSIDVAMESIVDYWLPVKNTSLSTSIHRPGRTRPKGRSTNITNLAEEELKSDLVPTGGDDLLNDASQAESAFLCKSKRKCKLTVKESDASDVQGPRENEYDNTSWRSECSEMVTEPAATKMYVPPIKNRLETSSSSIGKKRNVLGWLFRSKSEQASRRTGLELSNGPVTNAGASLLRVTHNCGTNLSVSRYIHDDECTLTQEQSSMHIIRMHRVPTDFLVAKA
jgi:hypothetical protein